MRGAAILTTRKRVIVALAHSAVFLLIAGLGMTSTVRPLRTSSPASGWVLAGVYFLVSEILAVLAAYAGHALERLYFALCGTSAAFGLARQILGDPPMHVAVYIRVLMLGCAVLSGIAMLRRLRSPASRGADPLVRAGPPGPAARSMR